jgi:hypothetical protein
MPTAADLRKLADRLTAGSLLQDGRWERTQVPIYFQSCCDAAGADHV